MCKVCSVHASKHGSLLKEIAESRNSRKSTHSSFSRNYVTSVSSYTSVLTDIMFWGKNIVYERAQPKVINLNNSHENSVLITPDC